MPERLVVAATMTSGEKGDGPELPTLISKAKVNIPDLKEVVGDSAYSGQNNLENACKEEVELVANSIRFLLLATRAKETVLFLTKMRV